MNKNKFQVEDLEAKAMKKSNAAKRAAIAGGAVLAGAGAAFAANEALDHFGHKDDDLKSDELAKSLGKGASESELNSSEAKPSEIRHETAEAKSDHHTHSHSQKTTTETGVHQTGSVAMHDEEGNLISQVDSGTVDGKNYALIDHDGDGYADILAIDENKDGQYQENEMLDIRGEGVRMNNDARTVHLGVNQQGGGEGSLSVEDTMVIHDEEGNIIGQIDAGKVGGHDYVMTDTNGDGYADMVKIDLNDNGEFEDDERRALDNTHAMASRDNAAHYMRTSDGDFIPLESYANSGSNNDDINGIHNDYKAEKTGEVYTNRNDIAQNNPDYNGKMNVNQYASYQEELEVTDNVPAGDNGATELDPIGEQTAYTVEPDGIDTQTVPNQETTNYEVYTPETEDPNYGAGVEINYADNTEAPVAEDSYDDVAYDDSSNDAADDYSELV